MEGVLIQVDESITQYILAADAKRTSRMVTQALDSTHLFVKKDKVEEIEALVKSMYDEMSQRIAGRMKVDELK